MTTFAFDNVPRLLWREFKKNRKLRKWESLPLLKLLPQGRPLFVCQNCHFANLFGILCLWCSHTCDRQPSLLPEVRRRASAPELLSEAQKEQLHRMDLPSLTFASGSRGQIVPGIYTEEAPEGRRRRHRGAAVISVEVHPSDEPNPTVDLYVRALAESNLSLLQGPRLVPSIAMVHYSGHPDNHTLGSTDPTSNSLRPSRTLRRKQRLSVLRQRSSCSLRRKAMLSSSFHKRSRSDLTSSPSLPHRPSHIRLPKQVALPRPVAPTCDVPLGHPNRPLYTAIRKNMSRPTSPTPSFTPTPLPSPPIADVQERGTRSLDLPSSRSRINSLLSSDGPQPVRMPFNPAPSGGFSLSGEMEMRSQTDVGLVSRYRFRQTRTDSRKPGDSGSLKLKVKKIQKNLKDLMTLRI
ncbi:unnamed protein product [Somion occarium]|uniref:Uncharacterized protein n=1 Tax=Somion occarium TaxID=3059160 RepID=A0ABP1E9C9_9APHY